MVLVGKELTVTVACCVGCVGCVDCVGCSTLKHTRERIMYCMLAWLVLVRVYRALGQAIA